LGLVYIEFVCILFLYASLFSVKSHTYFISYKDLIEYTSCIFRDIYFQYLEKASVQWFRTQSPVKSDQVYFGRPVTEDTYHYWTSVLSSFRFLATKVNLFKFWCAYDLYNRF
jgi:hypothetical protein